MREVIYRRFRKLIRPDHYLNGEKIINENEGGDDPSFSSKPDLLIIDGGKGQLSSAVKVLDDLQIKDQNIIGLAKRLEEVYFPGESDPQNIPKTSAGLKLLQRIRDEAHRFAVTYHRSLRDKRTFATELTEVEGIGEKTAQKLLTEFGSVENIKEILKNNYGIIENSAGKKTAIRLKDWFEI